MNIITQTHRNRHVRQICCFILSKIESDEFKFVYHNIIYILKQYIIDVYSYSLLKATEKVLKLTNAKNFFIDKIV